MAWRQKMGVAIREGDGGVLDPDPSIMMGSSVAEPHAAGFESLFVKYYPRVLGVLYRLVGDRGLAEELANDVFWKLHRQPWLAESDGNVGGWLCRTATNLGIDHLRAAARRRRHEEAAGRQTTGSGASPDPLADVLRAERAGRVRVVLAKLKPTHAQILILRASGLSYKELADSLGVKLGTVGTMLVRAEEAFQSQFRRMYAHEEAI
jgi:RNA polymerase sigma factor (sigma-70 family)